MTGNGTTKIILYFSWSKQGITVLHVPVVQCVLIKFVHVHVRSPKDKAEKNLRFQKKPEPSMPVHSSFILYFSATNYSQESHHRTLHPCCASSASRNNCEIHIASVKIHFPALAFVFA